MTDKLNNEKENQNEIDTKYIDKSKTEYINEETEYKETDKDEKSSLLNQRYEILNTLGKGGMGCVYKALDKRLKDTPVAIKEISLETIGNENIEKVIENFENEAKILVELRHNSIPRIMDFFCLNNNKCYIVMDLIEGETLSEVIDKRGKIPEDEVRNWLVQLADVISYLHNRNPKIIFRDLKPSNVMITKDNEIKLIDFGIARTFKNDKDNDTECYVSQGFSAPEQYGTGQSDERSDIYSLGALLYSLLIGEKPKIKNFKFESLKNFVDVSDELDNAIMLATEFRPENRPSSIEEFMKLLNPDTAFDDKNNTDIVEDNEVGKTNSNKNSIYAVIALSLVLGGYMITKSINKTDTEITNNTNIEKQNDTYTKETYSENLNNSNEKEVIKVTNNEKTLNVKDIKDPTDELVIRAMDEVYTQTEDNKSKVKYEYSPNDNFILEDYIKDKYYVFKSHNIDENGNVISTDPYNYLVNKETFNVWIYFAGGQLERIYSMKDGKLILYDGNFLDERYEKYYYKLNPNIKKAYDSIIETIGVDNYTKYEYDPLNEDNSYSNLNDEYYLFEDYYLDYNGEINTDGDTMIAVNKKTLEVYVYTPSADYNNILLKYGEEPNYEEEFVEDTQYTQEYNFYDVVGEDIRLDYEKRIKESEDLLLKQNGLYRYGKVTIDNLRKYDLSKLDNAKVVYELSDKLLNGMYQQLKNDMIEDEFNEIRENQKIWVSIKENYEKNTQDSELLIYQTLIDMTLDKCDEFNEFYNAWNENYN